MNPRQVLTTYEVATNVRARNEKHARRKFTRNHNIL